MPTDKSAKPAKAAKSVKPAKSTQSAPAAAAAPVAADPAARIAALAELLKKYKDAYYNGHPMVSDAAYDQLEDELRALAPDHPLLASVGAPVPVKARPRAAG